MVSLYPLPETDIQTYNHMKCELDLSTCLHLTALWNPYQVLEYIERHLFMQPHCRLTVVHFITLCEKPRWLRKIMVVGRPIYFLEQI